MATAISSLILQFEKEINHEQQSKNFHCVRLKMLFCRLVQSKILASKIPNWYPPAGCLTETPTCDCKAGWTLPL
ncbi:hypothetical protein [Kamptonema formosum]|uniref:hypothetical protein n=1 Tax=Kamptonema formosum TaxID=331992 RepID=UPI0012DBF56C|nr:hypothetical protein [Oscillatoria sp. PCC 10802]